MGIEIPILILMFSSILYLAALEKWKHALLLFISNSVLLAILVYYGLQYVSGMFGRSPKLLMFMLKSDLNTNIVHSIGVTIIVFVIVLNIVVLYNGVKSYKQST